jgi:hypothetical protein
MCIRINIYVYMYMCIVYICICVYVYVYVYVCIYIYISCLHLSIPLLVISIYIYVIQCDSLQLPQRPRPSCGMYLRASALLRRAISINSSKSARSPRKNGRFGEGKWLVNVVIME